MSGRIGIILLSVLLDPLTLGNVAAAGDIANAFIEITFADSVKENVSVPMVKCGEIWKMQ
jgi:hypothetical protein